MYARVTLDAYTKGLKVATNILPIPQGGARKRFGTRFSSILAQTEYVEIKPIMFEYLSEADYQVIVYDDNVDIYLEDRLVGTVGGTGIIVQDIPNIDFTVLEDKLRLTSWFHRPVELVRTSDPLNIITAFTADPINTFTITTAIDPDIILPAKFEAGTSLPTTTPQMLPDRTYFIRSFGANTVAVYASAVEARNNENRFIISSLGVGQIDMFTLNVWTVMDVDFKNVPTFDFDGGYDAITFTPGATTGSTTLTASAAIFTVEHVGGVYDGGGGSARITAFTSTTVVDIDVIEDFDAVTPIKGTLSSLKEPAWSDKRGWPRVCSSFQNRAFFANTELLPNGLWGSSINDYNDFDDSQALDDNAISWYPTSDVANEIKFITPFKNMVVHTNAGSYSTPMNSPLTITPREFYLNLQDDTPSTDIQPVTIDNQIFATTGNDVYSLIWDEAMLGYSSVLISSTSDHLIKKPVSMASFRDNRSSGGRYVFITNQDGSMAMYQTLMVEKVAGWAPAITEQAYGDSSFRYVISNRSGRCWFVVERFIAATGTAYSIDGFDIADDWLLLTGSALSETEPMPLLFAGTTLPQTAPQIKVNTYYYGLSVGGEMVKIFPTQQDALDGVNYFEIQSAGTAATATDHPLSKLLILEELSNSLKSDCTIAETAAPRDVVTGLTIYEAQTPNIKCDGLTFDPNPIINGSLNITAQGQSTEITTSQIGFKVKLTGVPLPISIATGGAASTSNLTVPKHIRSVDLLFANSVGGKINKQNIVINTKLKQTSFTAPVGKTGKMTVSIMAGWDDFNTIPFTITHDEPYDFTLLGLFYKLEI
ncbi:MAG: hypothetical protein DRP45_11105 [Candidatus Zixiibacteriota bacterium]|nr:MAG: hypothetical protein DRP45_11105 [candidate division Zixibacteria bacterium]